jgi:hypothetical protein
VALLALGLSLPSSPASAQSRRKRAKQTQPAPVEKADSWDADAEDTLAPEPAPRAAEPSEPSELPSDASNNGAEAAASETEAAPEDAQVQAGAFGPRRVAQEHRPDAATYRLPKDRVWAPLVWDGGRMHAQVELDVGYAGYKYPEHPDRPKETLNDMRGRFVLGPPRALRARAAVSP